MADESLVGGDDDSDVELLDEHEDSGAGVGSADADVVSITVVGLVYGVGGFVQLSR